MKKYLFILLLLSNAAIAQTAECSSRDAYAADSVVDYLDSWHNANLFYRQFKACDDGGIAEGVSEKIAQLLVNQWSKLDELLVISSHDPAFKTFVLSHIDGTLNINDLRKIKNLAETNCPKIAIEACAELAKEAAEAIKNP